MPKLGAPAILSLVVILLGVFFFIAAVAGLLFEQATPIADVGMWSVTIVLLALGGLGFWASMAERDHQGQ